MALMSYFLIKGCKETLFGNQNMQGYEHKTSCLEEKVLTDPFLKSFSMQEQFMQFQDFNIKPLRESIFNYLNYNQDKHYF